jgi:hypothetical protein
MARCPRPPTAPATATGGGRVSIGDGSWLPSRTGARGDVGGLAGASNGDRRTVSAERRRSSAHAQGLAPVADPSSTASRHSPPRKAQPTVRTRPTTAARARLADSAPSPVANQKPLHPRRSGHPRRCGRLRRWATARCSVIMHTRRIGPRRGGIGRGVE